MLTFASLHRRLLQQIALAILPLAALAQQPTKPVLPERQLAQQYFGADASWFLRNIPFLEIDDPDIQRVYYYRWQLYRSHLREIGTVGTEETEFLPEVPWGRHPFTDLNDSSSFHILEGRWLRDPGYITSLVDHLYSEGGNDRHFSESIASATYAWTQVTGDPAPALRHLDTMEHIYNLWDDHFDAQRNLYWIEPLLDATEYTISSIDASGAGFTDHPSTHDNENGFTGGFAFRPSINAYQFGNAMAIANLARIAGQPTVAAQYTERAESLRYAVLTELWNPKLTHFTDIYQRSTQFVSAGDFIRGRELVGYLPWAFELPPQTNTAGPDFAAAWQHLLNPSELAGSYGLRTVEPSYPHYLQQYRYDRATGLAECQWNGPSWPFQTSQALTAMANLLHDYPQHVVTAGDYVHLLRQYTRQHMLGDGKLDLEEDYNPDTGKPIVGLPRSHHYNHSTYIDLIFTGLLGLRPHSDDVLELDPLLPAANSNERPIRYFAVQGLRYHGHDLTLVFDADGSRYHLGAGLSVFSDGARIAGPAPLHRLVLPLKRTAVQTKRQPADLAVNLWGRAPSAFEPNLPRVSASDESPEAHPYEAVDGRLWFFPEIANGWSPAHCEAQQTSSACWLSVDLRQPQRISRVQLFFSSDSDGKKYQAPAAYQLQWLTPSGWQNIPAQHRTSATPQANALNEIDFPAITTQQLRVVLTPPASSARIRLIEFEAFAP